jgi:hypothetical protein
MNWYMPRLGAFIEEVSRSPAIEKAAVEAIAEAIDQIVAEVEENFLSPEFSAEGELIITGHLAFPELNRPRVMFAPTPLNQLIEWEIEGHRVRDGIDEKMRPQFERLRDDLRRHIEKLDRLLEDS